MVRETSPKGGLGRRLASLGTGSPERVAYTFLVDGEAVGEEVTWGEVWARAAGLAGRLASRHRPGDRAVLVYPPGLDFVVAFYACLLAGVVAVPAYPPRRRLHRLRSIAADCQATSILTTADLDARLAGFVAAEPDLARLPRIATDGPLPGASVDPGRATAEAPPVLEVDPAAPAFLQYTSGSTGSPKGVVVTHGNLVHNQGLIADAFRASADDVVVSWLPLHHDMGLVGGVLQPLWVGARCVLMSPAAFLQRPTRWLEAIHRHRGTLSGGPDFAYALLAERLTDDDLADLDLSSWRVAFDGSEPVRASTVDRFARRLAPTGFSSSALFPCYGLAEATLFVSGGPAGEPPTVTAVDHAALERGRVEEGGAGGDVDGRLLVSSGRPSPGLEVAVVDPKTRRATDDVGEIWVRGESVAAGYFQAPEATAETFGGRRADESETAGPWLRTGDLGFLRDGALTVTGRSKELIILHGRNLYPQDIEASVAAAHEAVRAGAVAAFADDRPRRGAAGGLVVVAELHRHHRDADPDAVSGAVRAAVLEDHEAPIHDLVLIRHGTLPKTTSGKIRRRHTRELWRSGGLEVAARAAEPTAPGAGGPPRGELERRVAGVLARLLDLPAGQPVGRDDDLFRLGGHSLLAARLGAALDEELGVELTLAEVLSRPTVAGLAARVAETAALAETTPGLEGSEDGPVEPWAGPGAPPLSPAQERLWFLDRLEPGGSAYNIPAAVTLAGALDRLALARALAALARRHRVLGSRFPAAAERPVQVLDPPAEAWAGLPVVDLGGLEPRRRRAEADRWTRRWALRPFDLAAGRPWRTLLLADGERRHRLALAVHHIVADGWSLGVMLRQMAAVYRHGPDAVGPVGPLGELQYGDWAARERRRVDEGFWDDDLAWWRERLTGAPALVELPTDRPRPPVRDPRGRTQNLRIPARTAEALAALGRSRGASLFAVLATALAVLLERVTGQRDVVLGAPTAGRGADRRLDDLVGLFVNMVALRFEVDPARSFARLVETEGRAVLEALARGAAPFDRVLDATGVERSVGHTPLFQVALAFQNFPLDGVELPGLVLERQLVDPGTVKFDWDLSIEPRDDGALSLSWGTSTALFDPTTMERALRRLERLLEAVAQEPTTPIRELDLLSAAERHQLLAEWGWSPAADETRGPVTRQILERAADAPGSPAAVGEVAGTVQRLGFDSLARRSAELALHLRRLGVGDESPVAVLGERRPWVVVAALAVARAGGVYLPLDPALPPERLALVLDDAARLPGHPTGAPVPVVTTDALGARLEAVDARLQVVPVAVADGALPEVPEVPEVPGTSAEASGGVLEADAVLDPDRLAYVIHTSGSTGTPKGVMVPWRGLLQRVLYALDEDHLAPGDRFLFNSSLSFDVSLFGLLGTLAHGATPVLTPPGAEADADALVDLLAGSGPERGIDYAVFTPALLGALAEHPGLGRAGQLSTLASGGEAMAPELPAAVAARLPGVDLYNRYGPTEASIYVTSHRCRRRAGSWAEPAGVVPIGRPTAGARLAVVGSDLSPVPPGSVGELLIGGPLLARGYLGRPAATAEAFVPDGLSPVSGERLYRTGDLVRWRGDGELLFVGRRDDQVKLRGFRVELDEVAAALAELSEVVAAAAHLWPGRLVGYLVVADGVDGADGAGDDASLLDRVRAAARRRLPDWMMPADLVVLPELPLTAAGKLDRRALPAPDDGAAPHRPPEGLAETTLAQIWSRVLGVERVGRDDNFFRLGGDSITSIRVIAQAREAGWAVEPRDLFQAQTVAELARRVARVDTAPGDGVEDGAPDLAALAGVELSDDEMDDLLLELDEVGG
jgi:amino acid adenylation domain-containing protein